MRTKNRLLILLPIVFLTVGYALGTWRPLPGVDSARPPASQAELYGIVVGAVSAVATLFATIIALFKEDIRTLWEKASPTLAPRKDLLEVFDEPTQSSSTPDALTPKQAARYNGFVEVQNDGTVAARDCYLVLERLSEISDAQVETEHECDLAELPWKHGTPQRISIPPTSTARMCLIAFLAPESKNVGPDKDANSARQIPARLQIGHHEFPARNSRWKAVVAIYGDNFHPRRVTLAINWDGKWEHRLAEMRSRASVTLEEAKGAQS